MNVEQNPISTRLAGRVDYLLNIRRVKDPELMQSALEALTDLADACACLLDDMGEPDDGAQANLMGRCRAAIAKATGRAPDAHPPRQLAGRHGRQPLD
jgi:hypothetical protein